MLGSVLEPLGLAEATPPRTDDHAAIVQCLRQSKLFLDYQQAFESTTGFPLVLRAAGSFQVPLEGSKRTNPFCALMTGASKTCSACLQFQQRAEDAPAAQSTTLQCYAGLSESMVPVRTGQHVLGYLQTGQVFLSLPSARRLEGFMPAPPGREQDVDRRALETAYFNTRVVKPDQYRAIIQLLVTFAEHLALVSNQLLMSRRTIESPWLPKIRAFIADHQEEELRLVDVARAVNMNSFYFCKLFKRATGLTFTEYLARARVEAVKEKLQNVHVRVSEAAFASGFQSLSQFNRVFRRIAGEAPSFYRARLHGLALRTDRVPTRLRRFAVG
jgi:AraC-like DNA-binding protein